MDQENIIPPRLSFDFVKSRETFPYRNLKDSSPIPNGTYKLQANPCKYPDSPLAEAKTSDIDVKTWFKTEVSLHPYPQPDSICLTDHGSH